MKIISSLIAFIFFTNIAVAQTTPCEVMVDSIKGTYTGDCVKGKAEGEGKSTGLDSYEGSFKNGYPDGHGTYSWKNGDRFTGNWKKGSKEGKGELFTKATNSSMRGFWKKNVYKGEYEKPFEIHNTSSNVSHNDFSNLSRKGNSVTIVMISGVLALVNVDNFDLVSGSYQRVNKRQSGDKTGTLEFQDVQFPIRFKIGTGSGSPFDFEIFEKGEWIVNIHL